MSGDDKRHLEQCAGLALGVIEPADRRELDELLAAGSVEASMALQKYQVAVELLAESAPPAVPDSGLKALVLKAIETERLAARAARKKKGRFALPPVAGWVAAGLFAVVAVPGWMRETAPQTLAEKPASDPLVVLGTPNVKVAKLTPTGQGAAELSAWAFFDPDGGNVAIVFHNYGVAPGRDFELWAIRGNKPQSLGLVRGDKQGHSIMSFENLEDGIAAFAVSREPEGGSKEGKPTGPILSLAPVAG